MRAWSWMVSLVRAWSRIPIALLVPALAFGAAAEKTSLTVGRTRFEERLARADSLLTVRQADASLRILDSLLVESRRLGSREEELRVLLVEARLHGYVGRPGPGRAAAAAALQIATARQDTLAVCEALRWLAAAAQLEGKMPQARAHAQRLIDLASSRGDHRYEAYGILFVAYDDLMAGNLVAAGAGFQRAAELFADAGIPKFELMALTGLGRVRDGRGDVLGARDCYRRVLEGARRLHDPYNEADALNNLGGIEFTYGDPSAACRFYRDALDLQVKNGNLAGSIVPAKNLALTCTYMRELDEAAEILNEAELRCELLGYRGRQAMVLEQLGIVRREQGRLGEATALFRRAAVLTSDASPDDLGRILTGLAVTLQTSDSLEAGLAILRDRFGPLRSLVSPALSFQAERLQGEMLFYSGRLVEAVDHLRRADRLGRSLGLCFRVAPLTYAARCHALMGRTDSARICLQQAVEAWESERARIRDPGWREQMDLDGRLLHTDLARLALSDATPESLAERSRFAFDALQRFKARTLRERMLGAFSLHPDSSAEAIAGSVTLAELQERWLEPDEVLLDIFLGTDGIYIFGVTRAECRARWIPCDPDLLQTVLRRYRDLAANPPGARPSAMEMQLLAGAGRQLSSLLFSPVADLLRTHERIIIAPDGFLNMIPVESLPLPAAEGDTSSADALIAWRQIARTPSASVLRDQRRRARSRASVRPPVPILALLGGEGSEDSATPGAYGEVSWLRRSFRGVRIRTACADSAASVWKEELAESGIIHLASHVLIDDVHPWRSGLAELRAHEIAGMHLPARLAVLAGCESAGGRVVSGEGVLGLTTAFTAATVPTVIATLWPISDRVTARFMKIFYAAMARGKPVGEALRTAQLRIRKDPETGHPFYWAGFVLVGEGNAVVPLEGKLTTRRSLRLLFLVAALGILGGLWWRVRR